MGFQFEQEFANDFLGERGHDVAQNEEIVEEAGLLHLYQPVLHELDAV